MFSVSSDDYGLLKYIAWEKEKAHWRLSIGGTEDWLEIERERAHCRLSIGGKEDRLEKRGKQNRKEVELVNGKGKRCAPGEYL